MKIKSCFSGILILKCESELLNVEWILITLILFNLLLPIENTKKKIFLLIYFVLELVIIDRHPSILHPYYFLFLFHWQSGNHHNEYRVGVSSGKLYSLLMRNPGYKFGPGIFFYPPHDATENFRNENPNIERTSSTISH